MTVPVPRTNTDPRIKAAAKAIADADLDGEGVPGYETLATVAIEAADAVDPARVELAAVTDQLAAARVRMSERSATKANEEIRLRALVEIERESLRAQLAAVTTERDEEHERAEAALTLYSRWRRYAEAAVAKRDALQTALTKITELHTHGPINGGIEVCDVCSENAADPPIDDQCSWVAWPCATARAAALMEGTE